MEENYLPIFNRLDLDERLWGILRAVKEDPALEKRLEHVLDLRRKRPFAQDDAIKRGAWEEIGKAKKPERWPERNNEIGRLDIGVCSRTNPLQSSEPLANCGERETHKR